MPKRSAANGAVAQRGASKKRKSTTDPAVLASDIASKNSSHCEELGIGLKKGGSPAVFKWLCCSIIFGNRLSEKTTLRAAKGLLKSGLADPKSITESDFKDKIEALNSEGNVQRGPSMSSRLESTAATVLEKYDGDLEKLRQVANKKAKTEKKLVKEFKGIGEIALNIFCREVQLVWEELFPFADSRTLQMAKKLGLPHNTPQELAELVGNDREKYVRLLAAVVKSDLRNDPRIGKPKNADNSGEGSDDGRGKVNARGEPRVEKKTQKENPSKFDEDNTGLESAQYEAEASSELSSGKNAETMDEEYSEHRAGQDSEESADDDE